MFDNPLSNGKAHKVTAPWSTPAGVVLSQMKFLQMRFTLCLLSYNYAFLFACILFLLIPTHFG